MRKLKKSQLEDLKKLTEFRKVMRTAELAQTQAELRDNEAKIQKLNEPPPTGKSIKEISSIALWQKWKNHELLRLNATQAVVRVECSRVEETVSKAIAEDATADYLRDLSKSEEKTSIRRQAELEASHFLPDNVSDQDI